MPQIRFYNTLTRRTESFEPIDPPNVYMYNCGPTVYDFQHVGNFRTFLFADVLRRFLELTGFDVHQVMNLTDVGHMTEDQIADGGGEDKMQVAAKRLKQAKQKGTAPVQNPDDPYQVAGYYIDAFVDDAKKLGMKVASEYPGKMPRATDHVASGMIPMIQKLLDNGHAYVADDGVVLFSVESFGAYGRLSGNTIDGLRGGAGGRVLANHQAAKRHPADFMLWKPDTTHLMKWSSPWGIGYPNWHIECSVMSTNLLGRDVIDIHTGGEDNIFPHHECEIAQTCGATGNEQFSRFWLHARHLLVGGEKMSKSKGTFYTARDVLEGRVTGRTVDPAVLRLELIKGHYRSNLNFTRSGLVQSASAVRRIRESAGRFGQAAGGHEAQVDNDHVTVKAFVAALGDDLNVAGALAEVFDFLRGEHREPAESLAVLRRVDQVLGVLPPTGTPHGANNGAQVKCRLIDEARRGKDYDTADRIRQELIDAGYDVKTTAQGTTATQKLA